MRPNTLFAVAVMVLAGVLNAGCGGADGGIHATGVASQQDASLKLSQGAASTAAGSDASGSLQVSAPAGFTGTLVLSATDLPTKVTAVFDPPSLQFPGDGMATWTLVVPADAVQAAAQTVTVHASGGGFDAKASLSLTVQAGSSPAAGFQVDASAPSLAVSPGSSGDLTVVLTGRGGFAGTVDLALAGLPAGVTATITPASPTLGATPVSVALHFSADASAAVTATPVSATLTARGGGQTQGVPLAISVLSASDPAVARAAVLGALKSQYATAVRTGDTPEAVANAMAAYMASRPEFASAGADPGTGTAWGNLQDGVTVIVGDNYPLLATRPAPAVLAAVKPISKAALSFPGAGLPTPPFARLMQSFQTGSSPDSFTDGFPGGGAAIADLKAYLSAKGYALRTGNAASTSDTAQLKAIAGDGLLFYASHGGRMWTQDQKEQLYALSTSEVVNPQSDALYAAELKAGEVVLWTGRFGNYEKDASGNDVLSIENRYGFTSRFVDKYLHFDPDAVVMLWACQSGHTPADFVDHFKPKAGAVLSSTDYLRPGFGDTAARYFVDRLLGLNTFQPESPPQRPFPADMVFADMLRKNLAVDTYTNTKGLQQTNKLVLTLRDAAQPPILTPSIQNLAVSELDETLTLAGFFGGTGTAPVPGSKVTVDGTPLTCPTWERGRIVCQLPAPGHLGSSGKVLVELPGGTTPRQSNPRWLHQWDLPIEYSWVDAYGFKGWRFDATGTLRYRGDVGSYRVQPGSDPVFPVVGMVPTKDSGLAVVASGAYFDGTCLNTLSGSASFKPGVPAAMLSSWLRVDTLGRTGGVALLFGGVPPFPFVSTKSGSDPTCTGTARFLPDFGTLDGLDTFPSPLAGFVDASDPAGQSATIFGLKIDLASDYGIRAKTFSKPFTGKVTGGSIAIGWPDVAHQPAELQGVTTPR